MKTSIAVVVALVIAAGAWWYFMMGGSAAPAASAPATVTAQDVSWQYADMGEDATGIPQTQVSVTISGKTSVVGTYQGSCSNVSTLADGEVSGTLCWYAGGGKEIGVFNEDGTFVVKVGDQDEGTAETPGVRGDFKTLFEIQ